MSDQLIMFDVDGTLIQQVEDSLDDVPRPEVVELLIAFSKAGFPVGVWSGGGKSYAEGWVRRLGLESYVDIVSAKRTGLNVALAVDDMEGADLGLLTTLVVPRASS